MALSCEAMKVLELKDRINQAARISSRRTFFHRKKEMENAVLYSKEFSQIGRRAHDLLLDHLEKKMPNDRKFRRNISVSADLETVLARRKHAERS